jgi:SAM-dependent methyltransferase
MPFRTFADAAEAAAYDASLDERWPARRDLRAHLGDLVAAHAPTHLIELCCGAGALAAHILDRQPTAAYTGFDITPQLLDLARQRLAPFGSRATLIEADLTQDAWLAHLPPRVDAVISIQSLHDLGSAEAVAHSLRHAHALLAPGGLLAYADMLPVPPPEENTNSGRMPVDRHLQLLRDLGYTAATCTWDAYPFGCFTARRA